MIPVSRPASVLPPPALRIFGIGGAGCAWLDRLVLDQFPAADLVALNTDLQALTGSVAGRRVHLGPESTRGLGTGGDPELGYAAAEESLSEIESALGEARLVILMGGLGGGTASGAMPIIAHAAHAQGARVLTLVTLPFGFEGKRRREQAEEGLRCLRETSDVLITFENDRMTEVVPARAGVQEGFGAVEATLSQCVRALSALTQRRGLLQAGYEEVAALFPSADLRALFGFGTGTGDRRAYEAVEGALRCPLLERGRKLKEADSVLVHLAGGEDLTLTEVELAVEALRKHLPESADLQVGLAVDPTLGAELHLTVLASLPLAEGARPVRPARPTGRPTVLPASPAAPEILDPLETSLAEEPAAEAAEAEAPLVTESVLRPRMRPLVAVAENLRKPALPPAESEQAARRREAKQEQMQFEPINRGRFEKSEPTIVDGQDLDVPTFLRRKLRL